MAKAARLTPLLSGLSFRSSASWSQRVAAFHSGTSSEARIKWTHTHAPFYFTKKTAKHQDEPLTAANRAFVQEVLKDTYDRDGEGERYAYASPDESLLRDDLKPWPRGRWDDEGRATTRIGLLGRKIGIAPMWRKDGTPLITTMIQIEDNHAVRHIGAEEFEKTVVAQHRIRPQITKPTGRIHRPSVVVGALSADPSKFTKDYCGLFTGSGVMPKKIMARFPVSHNALVQPGTPLYASHFQPGQFVDLKGRTVRRGFQGVMKRWGFSGMPSDSHGVTKSHRRPGCIGSGRDKGRVWPGQKLPGHVGNKIVKMIGLQIVRINYRHNIIYVNGKSVPGEPGEIVKVFDSKVSLKQFTESPKFFPTCYPEDYDRLPEEEYAEGFHNITDPTITYE